ncbi:MAG: nucleotidyltransferase family protein [Bacteroidales bacterium]|nr:nucleotidyltransferase family protein [Bacteroidales bacterium]
MANNPLQDRNYLHERHRLSHQQIDRFLGENRCMEFVQEKLKRLEDVKLFLTVTDRLRDNNIPFVCLKGPMLSFRIYGDPSVRFSHDIDLLLELDHIEPALKVMEEYGYKLSNGMIWPEKKIQQELLISALHHLSFIHVKSGHCIELHWKLTSNLPISEKKLKELVGSNLTAMNLSGRTFFVLNKEFELLFLMIHGARHKWSRLKWLVDINDYPFNEINHARFLELTQQLKANRIIGQTNYLLMKYFNNHLHVGNPNKIPAYMLRHAQECIENKLSDDTSTIALIRIFIYQILLFPDWCYKLKVINAAFFRHGDVLEQDFSSKASYFLYRPYSFIKRRILHVK